MYEDLAVGQKAGDGIEEGGAAGFEAVGLVGEKAELFLHSSVWRFHLSRKKKT